MLLRKSVVAAGLLATSLLFAQSSWFQPSLLEKPDVKKALQSVDDRAAAIVEEWIRIVEIPAPSTKEQARAKYVRAEMEKLLTDQTFYGRYNPGGKSWVEYQAPDGRTAYKEENCTYAGHWWIQDDLVCYRYDSFNQGKPACFALFRQKDQLSFYIAGLNGKWFLNAYTTERRPGNPDSMPVEGQACVGV